MFTWLNKQGVKSAEGYIFQRMHRFYYHYIEGDHCMQVNIEPCFDKQGNHSLTIYTDSLTRWLPPHDQEPLSRERIVQIKQRISSAMTFMSIAHDFE